LDVSPAGVGEMLMGSGPGFVKSMIVITHDLSSCQIADSILIMYAGKLAEKAVRPR